MFAKKLAMTKLIMCFHDVNKVEAGSCATAILTLSTACTIGHNGRIFSTSTPGVRHENSYVAIRIQEQLPLL
jgi:hypothetical protein